MSWTLLPVHAAEARNELHLLKDINKSIVNAKCGCIKSYLSLICVHNLHYLRDREARALGIRCIVQYLARKGVHLRVQDWYDQLDLLSFAIVEKFGSEGSC